MRHPTRHIRRGAILNIPHQAGRSPLISPDKAASYVLLGANGDICAMLPAFLHLSKQRGTPINVVVSCKYAPIFDGVSYVNPIHYTGNYRDCERAAEGVKELGIPVIVQSYGNTALRSQRSFVEEMWSHLGMQAEWDRHPLIFDLRSPEREAALLGNVNPGKMPMILVGNGGKSSPFDAHDLIWLLTHLFQDHLVVDLSRVEADQVYDLVGLYDAAELLVSTDTVHLHLSRASAVPVIALATDKPDLWHAAPRYRNQVGRFWYRDYPVVENDILECAGGVINHGPTGSNGKAHKIYHVHSEYPRKEGALRRHEIARATWTPRYESGFWVEVPAPDSAFERNSKTVAGDTRVLPFVGDVIDFCAAQVPDMDDLIVLTNDDTCFAPELDAQIEEAIRMHRPAFAHRWDFRRLKGVVSQQDIMGASWYAGSDLFLFTKRWWLRNRSDFPDLIMACEFWDCILRQMIKRSSGQELVRAIYHEWHDSIWQQPGFRENNAGQKYNIEKAHAWFRSHGSDDRDCYRQSWFGEAVRTGAQ